MTTGVFARQLTRPFLDNPTILSSLGYSGNCAPCRLLLRSARPTSPDDPYDTQRCFAECRGKWLPTHNSSLRYLLDKKLRPAICQILHMNPRMLRNNIGTAVVTAVVPRLDTRTVVGIVSICQRPNGSIDNPPPIGIVGITEMDV